ncbi:MAG: hypothetical protein WAO71_07810, partial [Gallionella sp.]
QNFAALGAGEVVAIDGKTARHSYNQAAKLGAIHMVSAWATQAGLALGQVKTEKSLIKSRQYLNYWKCWC